MSQSFFVVCLVYSHHKLLNYLGGEFNHGHCLSTDFFLAMALCLVITNQEYWWQLLILFLCSSTGDVGQESCLYIIMHCHSMRGQALTTLTRPLEKLKKYYC